MQSNKHNSKVSWNSLALFANAAMAGKAARGYWKGPEAMLPGLHSNILAKGGRNCQ